MWDDASARRCILVLTIAQQAPFITEPPFQPLTHPKHRTVEGRKRNLFNMLALRKTNRDKEIQ